MTETLRAIFAVSMWYRGATLALCALSITPWTVHAQAAPAAPLTAYAVRAARAKSNTAIAHRDTATLVSMVSLSYHSVSSRNAHTNGRDGVRAQWRAQFTTHADVSYVRTPNAVRVFAPWQMAEENGTWVGRWAEPDGRVEIRGTYTAKWRRIDGVWLLEAEVYMPRSCTGSAYCRLAPDQPKAP